MRVTFLVGVVALASISVAPAAVVAQPGGVAATCNIDANSPKELGLASFNIQRARSAQSPTTKIDALKAVMKELDTKPERYAKNPAGYNYTLSQVLTMYASDPAINPIGTRGGFGLVTNPTEPYDAVAKLNEAYNAIVAALPNCAADIAATRQNEAWLALTRKALDMSNSGQLDSAQYYANRALILSKENPYPYYVLGNVANQKSDRAAAIANWKKVLETSGTDTTYRELKHGTVQYLAASELEQAQTLTGAEQQAMARSAAGRYKELLAMSPDGADAPNLMDNWATALKTAGDSAQIPTIYAPMIASPAAYTDFALTMGGVLATRSNKSDDALVLFAAAAEKNSKARDALRNLAATYYGRDMFMKMWDPATKLTAIDPNNYDAWMMYAYASQGLLRAAKLPAEKKAWTDSLVKYQTFADSLPAKVDVVSFQRTAKDGALTLAVEQQRATPGTYSVVVEFLDAKGAVVASDTQSVGPIAKGATKNVVFKASGAGIIAYQYKPLK